MRRGKGIAKEDENVSATWHIRSYVPLTHNKYMLYKTTP